MEIVPRRAGNIDKRGCALVFKELWRHAVGSAGPGPGSIVRMTVCNQEIFPAIIIDINRDDAKREFGQTWSAQRRDSGGILKHEGFCCRMIQVQGIHFAEEMCQENINQAVAVQISDRDSHAGLSKALFIECDIGEDCLFFQNHVHGHWRLILRHVRFDAEEIIRLTIIRHIDFRSRVSPQITDRNPQCFSGQRRQSCRCRTIHKGAVAIGE